MSLVHLAAFLAGFFSENWNSGCFSGWPNLCVYLAERELLAQVVVLEADSVRGPIR